MSPQLLPPEDTEEQKRKLPPPIVVVQSPELVDVATQTIDPTVKAAPPRAYVPPLEKNAPSKPLPFKNAPVASGPPAAMAPTHPPVAPAVKENQLLPPSC